MARRNDSFVSEVDSVTDFLESARGHRIQESSRSLLNYYADNHHDAQSLTFDFSNKPTYNYRQRQTLFDTLNHKSLFNKIGNVDSGHFTMKSTRRTVRVGETVDRRKTA